MKCDRCGKETVASKMSWFNFDIICMECATEEENHPDFQRAKDTIREQEKLGNMDYEGIGWNYEK